MRSRDLVRKLHEPVDAASLGAFRALFGALMVALVVRFWAYGWIKAHYLEPEHFFTYCGFEWVRPLPGWGNHALYVAMGCFAFTLCIGLKSRLSAAAFGMAFTYAHLIDKTHYLNHYYLIGLLALLLAVVPSGQAWSVDAWRDRRPPVVGAWSVWLLRFQIGVVYFFGGVGKLKADWLIDAMPLRLWLARNTDVPLIGQALDQPGAAHMMSWGGAAFDLAIPFLLLWSRSRPFAFAAVIAFHVVVGHLFMLGMFPWLMPAVALIFFSPDWPRRTLAKLGRATRAPDLRARAEPHPNLSARLLLVYASIQLLVPLRHLAYPGDVLWTEDGFRFSWNVMLMEKNGVVDFRVVDAPSGQGWEISPRSFLTDYQVKMMSTQPDMIVEAAHWLAEDFRARGVPDVAVYADAYVSLHGRRAHLFFDPSVDLAKVDRCGLMDRYVSGSKKKAGPSPCAAGLPRRCASRSCFGEPLAHERGSLIEHRSRRNRCRTDRCRTRPASGPGSGTRLRPGRSRHEAHPLVEARDADAYVDGRSGIPAHGCFPLSAAVSGGRARATSVARAWANSKESSG